MQTNEIIGYLVVNVMLELFVDEGPGRAGDYFTATQPLPVSRGDAFRRLAAYFDDNPQAEMGHFEVQPVFREITPIENAANELGGLFESLCARHGLDLGLTREQINAMLIKDLEAVSQGKGFGGLASIPGGKK